MSVYDQTRFVYKMPKEHMTESERFAFWDSLIGATRHLEPDFHNILAGDPTLKSEWNYIIQHWADLTSYSQHLITRLRYSLYDFHIYNKNCWIRWAPTPDEYRKYYETHKQSGVGAKTIEAYTNLYNYLKNQLINGSLRRNEIDNPAKIVEYIAHRASEEQNYGENELYQMDLNLMYTYLRYMKGWAY